jgi:hypothetical protein
MEPNPTAGKKLGLLYCTCLAKELNNYISESLFFNSLTNLSQIRTAEPIFVNLLRRPGVDSQPGGIDSWAP